MNASVKKAVIPVAGMGTRFLPATKALPKELLPLVDKPVVQYIVEEAVASGIDDIVFVINKEKEAIRNHFAKDLQLEQALQDKGKEEAKEAVARVADLAQFTYIEQKEPLGLGHAVLQAREAIGNEPFVVFGGDDVVSGPPAAKELVDVYMEHGGSVLGVMEVENDVIDRYGVIDPSEQIDERTFALQGVVEKPTPDKAPSSFGACGRWLLTPAIFDILAETPPGAGGEIQLTDAILTLMKTESVYARAYAGTYHDCGNIVEYAKAVLTFSLANEITRKEIQTYLQQIDLS